MLLCTASENVPLIGIDIDHYRTDLGYHFPLLPNDEKHFQFPYGRIFKVPSGAHLCRITSRIIYLFVRRMRAYLRPSNPKEGYSRLHNRETYTKKS